MLGLNTDGFIAETTIPSLNLEPINIGGGFSTRLHADGQTVKLGADGSQKSYLKSHVLRMVCDMFNHMIAHEH